MAKTNLSFKKVFQISSHKLYYKRSARNSGLPKIARTCCRALQKQVISSWGAHEKRLVGASLEIPSGPSYMAVSEPMYEYVPTPSSAATSYIGCRWARIRHLCDRVLLTGKQHFLGDCLGLLPVSHLTQLPGNTRGAAHSFSKSHCSTVIPL